MFYCLMKAQGTKSKKYAESMSQKAKNKNVAWTVEDEKKEKKIEQFLLREREGDAYYSKNIE
jgi:hypothetical protein